MRVELMLSHRIDLGVGLDLLDLAAGRPPRGMRSSTRLTASRTSLAAASMSRDSENSMLMLLSPLRLRDSIVSMPSMPDSASSRICVTRVSTTAAEAPG